MKYFELKCTVYLKKDITFEDSFLIISRYISFCMHKDKRYALLHEQDGYKNYTFRGFYPIQKDKLYKGLQTYDFSIRSVHAEFIEYLTTALRENINNPYLLVVKSEVKQVEQYFIKELYSLTPVIVSIDSKRYWTKEDDLQILLKQLQDNLEKKYFDFYKERLQVQQNFIKLFQLKNQKLQTIKVIKKNKSFKFFGNKFTIVPNSDEVSQKLAFLSLGVGLGEKNSFGGGFLVGKEG